MIQHLYCHFKTTVMHFLQSQFSQKYLQWISDNGRKNDCTSGVGSHWAGKSITLCLAEEIVDGRAQKWAALLLLTHQLERQREKTPPLK